MLISLYFCICIRRHFAYQFSFCSYYPFISFIIIIIYCSLLLLYYYSCFLSNFKFYFTVFQVKHCNIWFWTCFYLHILDNKYWHLQYLILKCPKIIGLKVLRNNKSVYDLRNRNRMYKIHKRLLLGIKSCPLIKSQIFIYSVLYTY